MTPPGKLTTGLLLTGCAGYIDAVGFVELRGYYVSFMSGNTTRLGIGLAFGSPHLVALPLALILMFFGGALVGSLISQSSERWGPAVVLTLVLAILVAAIGMPHFAGGPSLGIVFLAAAGGAQNAALPAVGAARLGTTFVTGTLFAAAQDFARAIRGDAPPWRWSQHMLVWAALCAGALLGAQGDILWGVPALLAPALIYACFVVTFALAARQQSDKRAG